MRYGPILDIIIKVPLVQIFAMILGIVTIAFEYPAPFLKGTFMERNFTFKAVFLVFQATTSILFYQVCSLSRPRLAVCT